MVARPKTILIATPLYPPEVGGPATYSWILAEEMTKLGWEVKILKFNQVRSLPKIIRHLAYGWQVFKLAPAYQIVYAQDPVSVGLPVCLACWFRHKPFILKIVGDYAWEQGTQRFGIKDLLDDFSVNYQSYSWPVKLLKKIQTGVAKRAKQIIVPSNYLKKIVSNWGVNPNKIKVIYNTFQSEEVNLTKDQARQALGFGSNDLILISAGRLVPWKGFGLLIDLMPELMKRFTEKQIRLFIAGSGPEADFLQKKITNQQLTGVVKLTGQLDKPTLFKYLRAADLFVLNTAYEGFSHQLLEVMSTETIALVTNIGGNPELIKNEKQLIEYNNKDKIIEAIELILRLPIDKKMELARAQNYVKTEFTKEKMIANLIKELSQ